MSFWSNLKRLVPHVCLQVLEAGAQLLVVLFTAARDGSGFKRSNVAFNNTESAVGNSDRLPEMDLAYLGGKGYTAVSELMRAMILRTIEDLQSGPELRAEALEYLMSDDEEYILSFNSICRYFGFDPEKTRYAILNAKSRIRTRRRAA